MPRFGDGGGLKELEESLFAVASLALKSAIWAACALTVAVSSAMTASFSAIKGKIVGPAPQVGDAAAKVIRVTKSVPMTAIVQVAAQVGSKIP